MVTLIRKKDLEGRPVGNTLAVVTETESHYLYSTSIDQALASEVASYSWIRKDAVVVTGQVGNEAVKSS